MGRKSVKKGKGLIGDTFNSVVDAGKDLFKNVNKTIKTIISGRDDYQPKGRDILKKFGQLKIKSIEIGRDPVIDAIKNVLDLVSGGVFNKRVGKSFDDLFHLFIVITLENGKKIMTEKNEVIIISESIPGRSGKAEYKIVDNIPSITLQELFDRTKQRMGNKFFKYSGKDNNCQDYIVNMFKANNIGNESDIEFIKQDTKQLFKGLPGLRKFSNTVTDFAGKLDVLISGVGIKNKNNIKNISDNNIMARCENCNCEIKGGMVGHTSMPVFLGSGMKKSKGKKHPLDAEVVASITGGKIKPKDVENFFRNIGKKVIGKKATKEVEKFGEDAAKYITKKKGGLATDLIDYGVPAATGAVLGAVGSLGGPVTGVLGSAAGSKLGKEVIAKELHKATGAGMKKPNKWITFVKQWAAKHNVSYMEAIKSPKLKSDYNKSKK
jgi:hypothetical protein